eukprot:scaffold34650_cov50-Attheya_sp.AAC.1
MIRIILAYQIIGNHLPSTVKYFNRTKTDNGLFFKIDTSKWRTIPQMLADIDDPRVPDPSIHSFAKHLLTLTLFNSGKFVDSFDVISDTAPELKPETIQREWITIGNSDDSKCLATALTTRTQEANERIYHAMAWSEDKRSVFLLSKCWASMTVDEKTRPTTGMGEKPKRAEYLVMLQLIVDPTSLDSDGHTLGQIVQPATNLACEKLPKTLEEAAERATKNNRNRNITLGLSAEQAAVSSIVSKLIPPLNLLLSSPQHNTRPYICQPNIGCTMPYRQK